MSMTESVLDATAVEATLRTFIIENFFVDGELDGADSLTDADVIDSTGVLELVAWIEDTFDVEVPDGDILPENLDSITAIVRYVLGAVGG